jgi:parallel beta-helix repeat protein
MLIWGSRNKSEVRNNMIKLNQKVGIRVDSNSHPHIFLNEITSTFGNGVHICNGGTSFLEKNVISGSLNCNLVLEGPRNIDNYIYNNRIEAARGQGIFLLHCEKFLIAKNTITSNYNGIVCITSVVNIEDNTITSNKCNGVMLLDDCQVLLS